MRRRCGATGPSGRTWTPSATTTMPSGCTAIPPCTTRCASTICRITRRPRCATRVTWTSVPASNWRKPRPPLCWRACPRGKVALCVVGGGHDGGALAEAFVEADFPPDTTAVMVTGPLMPWETRQRLHRAAQRRTRLELLEFVPDPVPLIERADCVIAMGGYNTVCEVLSFEKPALIVPRVTEPEQEIRARRMQELGLLDVLHPDDLTPQALTEWLARDPGPPPPTRGRVDLGGLTRIPGLLAELLGVPAGPLQPAAAAAEVGLP